MIRAWLRETRNETGRAKMNKEQAMMVVCSIVMNETRLICELSDSEIEGYLIDKGFEDSKENVQVIRSL